MRKSLAARAIAVAFGLAGFAGMPARAQAPAPAEAGRAARPRTLYEDLQLFSGVLNQIRVNHPDSVNAHDLIMAAIRGMVHEADPYSGVTVGLHLTEDRAKAMREGKLVPVPVAFAFRDGVPLVVSVTPGSSASRVDVLPGDELVAIDGVPVAAETAVELDLVLAGQKRSLVTLSLERVRADGSRATLERIVRREAMDEESNVPVAFMLDAATGYARISEFGNARVSDDLHDALGRLERAGMQRLVLDLRDNPGGLVQEAHEVAGEFLPRGTTVYTSYGRTRDVTDTGRVGRSFFSREKRYPIVLLVNGGSASASELVAGALQDHDRALLVGRPTHGKALMMMTLPLLEGGRDYVNSWIYLNVGRMRTPCGRVIQRPYRGISRREYFRRAGETADTTGRPSCRTAGGRTVYGGGGVVPDVILPAPRALPPWLAAADEQGITVTWLGAHLGAHGAGYTTADALAARPTLAGTGVADFRRALGEARIAVPDGAEADAAITRALLPRVADAKWGAAGRYRVEVVGDWEIGEAVKAFERAAAILR